MFPSAEEMTLWTGLGKKTAEADVKICVLQVLQADVQERGCSNISPHLAGRAIC